MFFLIIVSLHLRMHDLDDTVYINQLFDSTLGSDFTPGTNVTLTSCSFTRISTFSNGSALYLITLSLVEISSCQFQELRADIGSLYVDMIEDLNIGDSV
jgi:hypothetical protein